MAACDVVAFSPSTSIVFICFFQNKYNSSIRRCDVGDDCDVDDIDGCFLFIGHEWYAVVESNNLLTHLAACRIPAITLVA